MYHQLMYQMLLCLHQQYHCSACKGHELLIVPASSDVITTDGVLLLMVCNWCSFSYCGATASL